MCSKEICMQIVAPGEKNICFPSYYTDIYNKVYALPTTYTLYMDGLGRSPIRPVYVFVMTKRDFLLQNISPKFGHIKITLYLCSRKRC